MYYYAPDNNRKGRMAGLIAVACYLVIVLAVGLAVSFSPSYETVSEGILIDFGDDSDGTGTENVALSQTETPSAPLPAPAEENYMTQDTEPAPAIASSETKHTDRTSTSQGKAATSQQATPAVEQRQVNRRALFPGRSATSNATSQGSGSNTTGNRGHEAGGDGNSAGTGTGTEGISFDLAGRRAIGSLPRPAYNSNNAQGIVVVEITVDAQGRVQSALFRPQGSTTQDAALMDAALRAARQARFTPSEANAVQTGTITYVFKLR